ncbi:MAG: hypothetical protein WBQ14_01380 [Gaiellaceae bacterium]
MTRKHTSAGAASPHGAGRLTRSRLIVRLVTMVAALVLIDLVAANYLRPSQDYDADWRLPRTQSMSALPGLVDHIEGLRPDPLRPRVLFLGASPTWGEMNRDRHHTYPAAFERSARAAGVDARVYNLGADGALVADDYFIAERLAGHADLLAIQLTYHTFNPAARIDGAERFSELPTMLGEPVDAGVAHALGIDRTAPFNLSGSIDRTLDRHWLLFREHDELATRLFGRPARDELFERWQTLTGSGPKALPLAPALAKNTPFDRLDPARQTEIVERYADFASFHIRHGDSELRMLDLLCARLESLHAHAAFFMSPLNIGALESFGAFDRHLYSANVAVIRAVVEKHGLSLIDWNRPGKDLPSALFADATHTTDQGSAVFARRLYQEMAPLIAAGVRS